MSDITIHKVNFSAPLYNLEYTEYVLGTFQQAWDYAVSEGSDLGALYDVTSVQLQGNTLQIKSLDSSSVIKILCNS